MKLVDRIMDKVGVWLEEAKEASEHVVESVEAEFKHVLQPAAPETAAPAPAVHDDIETAVPVAPTPVTLTGTGEWVAPVGVQTVTVHPIVEAAAATPAPEISAPAVDETAPAVQPQSAAQETKMDLIQTVETDATDVENFLVTEEKKVVAWFAAAPANVQAAGAALVADAKGAAEVVVAATGTVVSADYSAAEADLTTLVANLISKVTNGNTATLLTGLGAAGVTDAADLIEALVKPVFVKVLAALAPAA